MSSVIANELVKHKYIDLCFLSLFEGQEKTFYYLNHNIKRYKLYEQQVSGVKNFLGYIAKIRRFVKKMNIDILIDIDGILDMYSIPALVGTKVKLVSWEQFNYFQNPYVGYRKTTRRLAARFADAIVVLTDEDKGYYEDNLKIKNKIVRIYNPMEEKHCQNTYSEKRNIILSAGRLTEQKGFDLLIEVAKIVLEKNENWKWYILGDGEDKEKLEEKIQKYGLQNKLILKGSVRDIDIYYDQAAMFVLTSRYEGFGLVLTEAKQKYLPCISFECPAGPAEIIMNSINGYLVECFDIQDMAEKINKLIEEPCLRKEFSNNALMGTEKFNIKEIAEQWINLFFEI